MLRIRMFKRRKKKVVTKPIVQQDPATSKDVDRAKIEEVSNLATQLLTATKGMESIMLQIRNNSISLMEIASKVAQGQPISPEEEKTIHQTSKLLSKAAIQDMMNPCTDQDVAIDEKAESYTILTKENSDSISKSEQAPYQTVPMAEEIDDPNDIELDGDSCLAVELDWDAGGLELSESMELGSYVPSLSSGYNSKDLSPYSPLSDYNLAKIVSSIQETIPVMTIRGQGNYNDERELGPSANYDSIYEDFLELSLEDDGLSDISDMNGIADRTEVEDQTMRTHLRNLLNEQREDKTTLNSSMTSLHYDKQANPWNMYSCFLMDDIHGSIQSILSEPKVTPVNGNKNTMRMKSLLASPAMKSWNEHISKFTKGKPSFLPSVLRYPEKNDVNRKAVFV